MRQLTRIATLSLCAFVLFSATASAGKGKKAGGGGKDRVNSPYDSAFDFISEHAAELKVTPAQAANLEKLQDLYGKYCQDPAVLSAVKEMRRARKSGVPQDTADATRHLNAKLKEKSGGLLDGLQTDLPKILSAEQIKAYTEMRTKDAATQTDPEMNAVNPFGP